MTDLVNSVCSTRGDGSVLYGVECTPVLHINNIICPTGSTPVHYSDCARAAGGAGATFPVQLQ